MANYDNKFGHFLASFGGVDLRMLGYFRYPAPGRVEYFACLAEAHPQTRIVPE